MERKLVQGMKKYRIRVNGEEYEVEVEEIKESGDRSAPPPTRPEATPPSASAPPRAEKKTTTRTETPGEIKAPMSGKVLKINVNPGDEVERGQVVMVLEAMKMENEIAADAKGRIKEVKVSEGVSVNPGDTLIILE